MDERKSNEWFDRLKSIRFSRRRFITTAAGAAGAAGLGLLGSSCRRPEPTIPPGTGELGGAETHTPVPAATATSAPPAGPTGTLIALGGEDLTGSWNPAKHMRLATMWSEWNVFDRMLSYDPATEQFSGMLATDWEYVEPTRLRLTLREDIKFHEGQGFSAKDAKASMEYMSDPENVHGGYYPQPLKVEIVDDYTVDVLTENPLAALLHLLATSNVMCQDDVEDPDMAAQRQNGTGPFKWVKFENETVYYEANMDYWNGPPRLKEFRFGFVPDANTRLAALKSGEAHIMKRVPSEMTASIEDDPDLTLEKAMAVELIWFFFDHTVEPTNNKLVRQAIGHCVDEEGIIKNIMRGYAGPADSFVSPVSWGYAPASNDITYDPEKAKELIAEAGYPNGEGMPEFDLIFGVGFYANLKEYMEYIAAECNKIGIPMRAKPMEVAAWSSTCWKEGEKGICLSGFMAPSYDPDIVLGPCFRSPGILNFYRSPETDALLDKEGQEIDPETRRKILAEELYPHLMEELPNFPILNTMILTGVSNKVQNYHTGGNSNVDMHGVWLKG
jgi:peptide/nickel transport system substrate-binding protein